MTEQDIYIEAMNRQDAAERRRFLDAACGDNDELRNRLEKLIQHTEKIGNFLEDPPQPLAPAEMPLVSEEPGTQIGPYKIREQIGEGGMGAVYVAQQIEPVRRKVALKIIKPGMATRDVVARFEAERQALAMMDHPNIAKVLDAGSTEAGQPYFVMELVRGIPITEYCERESVSNERCLDLLIKVCLAIQHAHQKGIIHRDIKPSNILITLHDGVPVPKVIDFGVAKATQRELTEKTVYTQFQQFIGTPAYMSPEQAEMSGLDIDTRSDIYGLGVLAYELLTGMTPFDANELIRSGLDGMRRIICEREPLRPSSRLTQELETVKNSGATHSTLRIAHSAVDRDLDWIVMKCLEKERTRRYATASDLAADLRRYLEDEPVVARPPSTLYRVRKACRRNRLVFAVGASITASLVAGISISTWQALEARKAQESAEGERVRADAQSLRASESERQALRLQYASDINLAQQALINSNNLARARRLLDRHRPSPGEEDLRGWEWRYLWQLTRSQALATLTKRPAQGHSISFSPDGTRLAVGWSDGRVELWDVPGRRLERIVLDHGQLHANQVAFSPVRNLLAVNSEPHVVTLHDLDSGKASILWQNPHDASLFAGERRYVRSLVFSSDGSRLLIRAASNKQDRGNNPFEIWVVDVSSSQSKGPFPIDGGTARLSPDNRRLFLACRDSSRSRPGLGEGSSHYGYIQCIELSTSNELWKTEPVRDLGVNAMDISPDGQVLASGAGMKDSTIRIWDAKTGGLLYRLFGHTSGVGVLAFARDGRQLISAASQTIRIWDTTSWTETELLRGHTSGIFAVAISGRQQLFASVGGDGNLMLWKKDAQGKKPGYIRLPAERLSDIHELNRNDSRLLLLRSGKPPELVDLKSDSPGLPLPKIASSELVLGWAGSWAGSDVVCHWNGDQQVLVHELRGGTLIPHGAIKLRTAARPTGLIFNANRQLVAWTEKAFPRSIFVSSLLAAGHQTELKSDISNVYLWRFSEHGRFLTGPAINQSSVRAWNVETGQIVASVDIDGKAWDLDFAVGGQVLVASLEQGSGHEVRFFDLENPDQPPRRVLGREHSKMLAISRDGGSVACATVGGQVRLFDPVVGEQVGPTLHGHLNPAYGVAFSPDGKRLISTASGREAVKLWDVSTGQELLTLSGDGSYLYAARWLGGGDVILVGAPWQAWRAPSWGEIEAAETMELADSDLLISHSNLR